MVSCYFPCTFCVVRPGADTAQVESFELVLVCEVIVAFKIINVEIVNSGQSFWFLLLYTFEIDVRETHVDAHSLQLILRGDAHWCILWLFLDQALSLGYGYSGIHQLQPLLLLLFEPVTHIVRFNRLIGRHVVNVPQILLVELADSDAVRKSMKKDIIILSGCQHEEIRPGNLFFGLEVFWQFCAIFFNRVHILLDYLNRGNGWAMSINKPWVRNQGHLLLISKRSINDLTLILSFRCLKLWYVEHFDAANSIRRHKAIIFLSNCETSELIGR